MQYLARQLRKEIANLPADQSRCLEMKLAGYSYAETAARTGLAVAAVKSCLQSTCLPPRYVVAERA
jgi:DNA-directed RNA polymerase specialized sigma24 family protein